jgi:kynurenine formamidase
MLIDLTTGFSKEWLLDSEARALDRLFGHWGTHFDCMDKEFNLSYLKRPGVFFDVRSAEGRDIDVSDIDLSKVQDGMFVGFFTGWIEKFPYGSKEYFTGHPQLSDQLIDALVERKVGLIGIDACGIRRGSEHRVADQKCADHGSFVVENLCGLEAVAGREKVVVYTYPMKLIGATGVPSRVVAEIG